MQPSSLLSIQHFCSIKNGRIIKDHQSVFQSEKSGFQQFSEDAYRSLGISYPKFHKMDNLSKLAFLCSDLLLTGTDLLKNHDPYRIGVIISNKSASLDTDYKYFNMVKKGVASPAVFVYSLPSIMVGEICIRNGIKGENTFFISENYKIPQQVQYINFLFETDVIDACICGWVELIGEKYDSFLYLAEKSTGSSLSAHSAANVENLYQADING